MGAPDLRLGGGGGGVPREALSDRDTGAVGAFEAAEACARCCRI